MKYVTKDYIYLYGMTKEEIVSLADTPYKKALEYKIKRAEDLNTRLHEPNFMLRDNERINAVLNAIKFNHVLLKELVK